MQRKIEPVEVYAGANGHVVIKQDYQDGEPSSVFITPYQLAMFIEMLKQAEEEVR